MIMYPHQTPNSVNINDFILNHPWIPEKSHLVTVSRRTGLHKNEVDALQESMAMGGK